MPALRAGLQLITTSVDPVGGNHLRARDLPIADVSPQHHLAIPRPPPARNPDESSRRYLPTDRRLPPCHGPRPVYRYAPTRVSKHQTAGSVPINMAIGITQSALKKIDTVISHR